MTDARKAVLMQLWRGEISPDQAAGELSLSRRAVKDLQRRYLQSKLPKAEEEVNAPVDQPVTVLRDRWGVAHVAAHSTADCFTASR